MNSFKSFFGFVFFSNSYIVFFCSADDSDDDALVLNVKCHYSQAKVLKCIFSVGDCACIKASSASMFYIIC